mgnify:CR=1 FL=1
MDEKFKDYIERKLRKRFGSYTMAATEKFCLKWNDFESNVSGAFREIREERDFFDVTLACEDNQMEAIGALWTLALRKQEHAADLVTVDSDEENDFVFEFGNKNDIHVWIGVFEYVSDRMLVLFHRNN